MVEKHTYSKSSISAWQSNAPTAHVVLLRGINDSDADYEMSLARAIASVHVANWTPSVPRWFASGMGYWVAGNMFRRNPVARRWQLEAVDAMAKMKQLTMKQLTDFLGNNSAADQAALAGYRFVEMLHPQSLPFKLMVNRLQQGRDFESAFYDSYGITPDGLLKDQARW